MFVVLAVHVAIEKWLARRRREREGRHLVGNGPAWFIAICYAEALAKERRNGAILKFASELLIVWRLRALLVGGRTSC